MTEMTLTLDSPLVRSEIIGYMVFPGDEKYREWWRLKTMAQAIVSENLEVTLSPQEFKALNDGPGFDAMRELVRKATSQGGIIAGETLIMLLRQHRSGINASLGKTQYMLSKVLSRMPRNDSKPLPGSGNSIRKAWSNFRSVAHLWAARQFTHEHAVEQVIAECDLDKNPRNFLGLAASFHQVASALRLHGGQPILGANTWEVPSAISNVSLSIYPLSDDEKADLSEYEPSRGRAY